MSVLMASASTATPSGQPSDENSVSYPSTPGDSPWAHGRETVGNCVSQGGCSLGGGFDGIGRDGVHRQREVLDPSRRLVVEQQPRHVWARVVARRIGGILRHTDQPEIDVRIEDAFLT